MASSVTEYRMDEGMAVFEVAWEVLNKVGIIKMKEIYTVADDLKHRCADSLEGYSSAGGHF